MSIQRYDVVGYGQQDIVRSDTGEFVDFDDHCKEIDRLTRELAEAKARALPDGWVAVPVEAPSEVLSAMANATWLTDGSHIEMARRWNGAILAVAELSARPEFPKESSNVE